MTSADTIFALSSGPQRAGVAVLRVSGRGARGALTTLAGDLPKARRAAVRSLRRPGDGAVLDQALVLWFPGPNSFTGEDCVEFHVHGGRAVVASVLDALGRLPGLRLAEAGEFTRRAFEHGKLDLTAAEGLSDLIDAETEAQRAQAVRQMEGGLSAAAETWRREIVTAMALVEAAIDFSDEGDVSAAATGQAHARIIDLHRQLQTALADGRRGEILRDGFTVVIAGPPNAGKSSLLNALARRDVAIVSDEPGTTRDVVEVRLDVGGVPVVVMDTAGIREAPGKVEQEGVRRSLARAAEADLVLWVQDAGVGGDSLPPTAPAQMRKLVRVTSKVDLVQPEPKAPSSGRWPPSPQGAKATTSASTRAPANEGATHPHVAVSAVTGEGLEALLALIGERAGAHVGEPALITRARHRALIEAAAAACGRFLAGDQNESELRAEDLRQAAHALGRLTGAVDAEEVLGEIFGRFCIGK